MVTLLMALLLALVAALVFAVAPQQALDAAYAVGAFFEPIAFETMSFLTSMPDWPWPIILTATSTIAAVLTLLLELVRFMR